MHLKAIESTKDDECEAQLSEGHPQNNAYSPVLSTLILKQ